MRMKHPWFTKNIFIFWLVRLGDSFPHQLSRSEPSLCPPDCHTSFVLRGQNDPIWFDCCLKHIAWIQCQFFLCYASSRISVQPITTIFSLRFGIYYQMTLFTKVDKRVAQGLNELRSWEVGRVSGSGFFTVCMVEFQQSWAQRWTVFRRFLVMSLQTQTITPVFLFAVSSGGLKIMNIPYW